MLPAKIVVRPAVRRVSARRLDRLVPRRQLLAEARDHQQRVVDPQRQPHHRADGQREGVDVEPGGEEVEDPARGDHRDRAEGERDRRRDRRAEDEQEDDQQERQGEQLAALGGVDRFVLDRPREGGVAGLGRASPAAWIVLFEDLVRVRGTVSLTAVFMSTWKSARISARRGVGPQALRPSRGPRARASSPSGRGAGPRISSGPWRSIAAAGPAEQDRERGRVAEVFAQQLRWRARTSVPGTSSVVGSSLPSTPVPITAEDGQHERGDGEHGARMAQRQRLLDARLRPRGSAPCPAPPPSHAW